MGKILIGTNGCKAESVDPISVANLFYFHLKKHVNFSAIMIPVVDDEFLKLFS